MSNKAIKHDNFAILMETSKNHLITLSAPNP